MGASFSYLKDWWYGATPMVIMIMGLDAAGKTSILYRLQLGQYIQSIPTIGFNVETVRCGNVSFTIWDMGGGDKIRPLQYKLYTHYRNAQAIIWVIDSTQKDRFSEIKNELQCLFSEEHVKGVRFLVFNNKSDLEGAMSSAEVAEYFDFKSLDREWCIVTCSALSGDGLWEGLEKLRRSLMEEKSMNGEIC